MPDSGYDTHYQLKLKEGDLVQANITTIGHHGVTIESGEWANVDTARITEPPSNPSPGKQIYAKVTNIDSTNAELIHKRGVYTRNHLPGDSIRVLCVEAVSETLSKAVTDDMRNLDSIYVVGVAPGADATIILRKIRENVGIAVPETIHQPGIEPDKSLQLKTTAGTNEATLVELNGVDDRSTLSQLHLTVRLATPAWATGVAKGHITTLEENTAVVELDSYPVELPSLPETIKTSVRKGNSETVIAIKQSDVEIRVEFSQSAPLTGTAMIELTHRADGLYQAEILKYVMPPVSIGATFDGYVFAGQNAGRIQYDNTTFSVDLTSSISTAGEATMKIISISETITARIVGDIDPQSIDETESKDIDMTNLSKL